MALVQIGQGQYQVTSSGVYEIQLDDTNSTEATPGIDLLPGVHYISLILKGRGLVGAYGSNSQAVGIRGNNNAALTIIAHDFSLRGFRHAVHLTGCYLTRIRGLFVQDSWCSGIVHSGDNALIESCHVQNIGGQTFDNARAFGIDCDGDDLTIRNNTVRNVFNATEEAIGVSIREGQRALVYGNAIKNAAPVPELPNSLPGSWGFWIGGLDPPAPPSDVDLTHNLISGWSVGVGASTPTDGLIDENAIVNCTELMRNSGGLAVGGIDG